MPRRAGSFAGLLLFAALGYGAGSGSLPGLAGPVEAGPAGGAVAGTVAGTVADLGADLRRLVKDPALAGAEIGISVRDLATGASLAAFGADRPLVLASNQKLLTTAAAMAVLGPEARLETRLLVRGAWDEGVIRGDLVAVGGGDPGVSGRFRTDGPAGVFHEWARGLARHGLREVTGDLILDDRCFDGVYQGPTWPDRAGTGWSTAPVGALVFNDSCVEVRVEPGARPGAPVRVSLEPPTRVLEVEVLATTVADRARHRIVIERRGTRIRVRGRVWVKAGPLREDVSMEDPGIWFGAVLREVLEDHGIAIRGGLRRARADESFAGSVFLAGHATPVDTACRVANQRSQNLYAECLAKALAARVGGVGTFAGGAEAIRAHAASLGVKGCEAADGSGLSRGNRVPAGELTRFLVAVDRALGPRYRESLAGPGEDGSLRRRLQDLAGRVRAKTGTLADVSTLSGYVDTGRGDRLAFAILVNQASAAMAASRRLQDAVVRRLAAREGGTGP